MSKCAKCLIEHSGVGQSPEHPADLEWYNPLSLFITLAVLFIPVAIIVIILSAAGIVR